MDCTRLEGKKELVSRKRPNSKTDLDEQIKRISDNLKINNKNEIILLDDVIFSGNASKIIIEKFKKNKINVVGIRTAISTMDSYENFNKELQLGFDCGCLLGKMVIDQVCERDFYFGIAQSGISVLENNEVLKAPYFKPFGRPNERASIPKEYESYFSNGCLLRSIKLWKYIEEKSKRKVLIKDLPEKIINTNENERVINSLRKGLIYYEKNTNRDNGICR